MFALIAIIYIFPAYLIHMTRGNFKEFSTEIRERIEEHLPNANTITDLRRVTHLSMHVLKRYAAEFDFSLPKAKRGRKPRKGNIKPRPEMDRLILEGATLEKIGAACNSTRQYADQYVRGRGAYDFWVSRKEKRERADKRIRKIETEKRFLHLDIAMLATAHILQKLEGEPLHVKQAFGYYLSFKNKNTFNKVSVEKLIDILEKYYEAESNGEEQSFRQLGAEHDLSAGFVRYFLSSVGKASMHRILKIKRFSKAEKEAIERAYFEVNMNCPDIAYFLRRSAAVLQNEFTRIGPRGSAKVLFSYREGEKSDILNYRKASDIYLAADIGFSKEDVMELLDIPESAYNFAVSHQRELNKEITDALDILYPSQKHTKPYLE